MVGGVAVGEDSGEGGRGAGAAVLGGGVDASGGAGVGGGKRSKRGSGILVGCQVDLRVEWANEAICATWEGDTETVERAERQQGSRGRDYFWQGHWERPRRGTDTGWLWVCCVRRLVDDQGHLSDINHYGVGRT